jgi:hypothetical protein
MKFRIPLLALLMAASLGGVAVPMPAGAAVEIFFSVPPPPLRIEVAPAPRRGYLWAPGYWDAKGNKHAWKRGHWERQRSGHYYVEPRWVERNNGYALERGRWNRGDRDGDGVPNRRDRQPDNPNRH